MEELYKAIEEKIKASGYPRKISGEDVYDDICDQIDGKENGSYVLLSKFDDDVIFEYHISIIDVYKRQPLPAESRSPLFTSYST